MTSEIKEANGITERKEIDKDKLVAMLKSNSDSLKGMSIKISGKAEALEELVKLIVNGDIDYISPQVQQAVVESSIDEQVKELKDVDTDSVRKRKKA